MTSPSDSWVTLDEVKNILGSDAPTTPEGEASLQEQIDASVELLYSLSGRQFPGEVSSTVRPTSRPAQMPDYRFHSYMLGLGYSIGWSANWYWGICRGCSFRGCFKPYMIGLGRSPIISITEILIDGFAEDPNNYRVDDAKWLVREECCGGWPTCQNLQCPIGDANTFSVEFVWGQNPPQLGKRAAGMLASEFYKAVTPGMNCALPQRITNITRQGVAFTVLDPQTFIGQGMTGLYNVDTFISAYNPGKWIRRPTVWSPDVTNTARRQTS